MTYGIRDVVRWMVESFLGFGLFLRCGIHIYCVLLASPETEPDVTVGVVLDPIRDPSDRPLWNRVSSSVVCVAVAMWCAEVAPFATIGATGATLLVVETWLLANAAVLVADPIVQLVAHFGRSNQSENTVKHARTSD